MKQVFAHTATNSILTSIDMLILEGAQETDVMPRFAESDSTDLDEKKNTAKTRKSVTSDSRVLQQPSFVLHSYPYKETSVIVDLFSRDYGRVALVAKGAKRPHSRLRNVLQSFQPLTVGWSGKSEMRTLTSAEWVGGMLPLEKTALLCGFYLNELLVKFLLRDEPSSMLFNLYVSTINQLAHNESALVILRKFEVALLRTSGLIGDLSFCDEHKMCVSIDRQYVVDPVTGIRLARASDNLPLVSGKTLFDMQNEDYSDPSTQHQSKKLLRYLLSHHLHGHVLNTRQILMDLQRL